MIKRLKLHKVKVKLDDVNVHMTEDHTNVVEITDKIKMIMKYPVLNDMRSLTKGTTDMENIFEPFTKLYYQKYMMGIKYIIELI